MSLSLAGPMGYSPSVSGSGLAGNKIPKGYRQGQLQQFTPEQQKLFQNQFGYVSPESYTGRLATGDEDIFNEIEAPSHRQFQGQLGQLASRFSGLGTGGRKGSGFQNLATSAASNFAQDLASRRSELQRQALNDLMGFSNQILGQRPYEQFLVEKPQRQQQGGWGGLFSGAASGALSGSSLGPWGALAGGLAGGAAGYFS